MKKTIIAAAVIISSLSFTACTKENVAPKKANTLNVEEGNKDQLGQGDRSGDENKDQLGQGDRKPVTVSVSEGNKDQLGQGDRSGEESGDGNKDQLGQGDRSGN